MKIFYILSDIHSQYNLLNKALNKAGFDLNNENHILLLAGDILDRGDQGDLVIRFLEKLISQNRVIGIIGNHDEFLIELVNGTYDVDRVYFNQRRNGFGKTLLLGYEGDKVQFKYEKKVLDDIAKQFYLKYPIFLKWLIHLPFYLEYKNHVIVHGFLDFSLENWHDTSKYYAIWERGYRNQIPNNFHKKLIIGHTPNYHINNQNEIIFDNKKIMIDGGAALGFQINVLILNEVEI